MLPIFESLLPVFLLIALGFGLKRTSLINAEQWVGLERVGFYVFFPCLLFTILSRTDFYSLPSGAIVSSILSTIATIFVVGLVIRLPIQALTGINAASYSSVFQGFARWNAFIALAVVEKLLGAEGLMLAAVIVATVSVPILIVNVSVVGWLGNKDNASRSKIVRMLVLNPLIISSLIGLFFSLSQIRLYEPISHTIDLIGRITLPLGLILVGTGLIIKMPRQMIAASVFSTSMKLLVVPTIYVSMGLWYGLSGNAIIVLGICGSVPSAMNGYLIAREMGGDAPLYASIVTLQTVSAFFAMPMVIIAATYLAG